MDTEKVLTQYTQALERGSYKDVIALFAEDAVVNSPLYGKVRAPDFYRDLLTDTTTSTITVHHVFSGKHCGAAHFSYEWVLRDGTKTAFECVDIVEFSDDGKIRELTIIYDTYNIREAFEKMKK